MNQNLPDMYIAALTERDAESAARLLESAFTQFPGAWTTESARQEIEAFLSQPDRHAWIAVDDENDLLGIVGALEHSPSMWELHPLAVVEQNRRRGIGSALVKHLESAARASGIAMIWLGTDDYEGGTSLFGRCLYPNVLAHLQGLSRESAHPFRFYERLGYEVVGILPDASGPGYHDILMAKSLCAQNSAG